MVQLLPIIRQELPKVTRVGSADQFSTEVLAWDHTLWPGSKLCALSASRRTVPARLSVGLSDRVGNSPAGDVWSFSCSGRLS
jgi:hypothetical protein